ncbi:MAG TPA: type II CAAX endopeptidase family protein [Candidatus Acidoferrum sp.]|jgi:membrane protease YdiL (CAAX protease family)|nr:type II CAAX endopeptidase family protein [Candidatus Acidoferrum sp.]
MAASSGVILEGSAGRLSRCAEFVLVFLTVPLLLYTRAIPAWPITILLAGALGAYVLLRRDPGFDSGRLFRWNGARRVAAAIVFRDFLLLAVLGFAVWQYAPGAVFAFVRRAPVVWAAVMVLYPLLSVYPQELLFRAYFFHRFQGLFGSGAGMIAASAIAFSFVHIIFGNWIAIALTLAGGVLFGTTYRRSGSLLLASLEHAIFGNFLFTIGLGEYFYRIHPF